MSCLGPESEKGAWFYGHRGLLYAHPFMFSQQNRVVRFILKAFFHGYIKDYHLILDLLIYIIHIFTAATLHVPKRNALVLINAQYYNIPEVAFNATFDAQHRCTIFESWSQNISSINIANRMLCQSTPLT